MPTLGNNKILLEILNLSLLFLNLDCLLSVQQPPVLSDLHFQPHLDVQQQFVVRLLLLDGDFQLLQLHLQRGDGSLELSELKAASIVHLFQIRLHVLDLQDRGNRLQRQELVGN